MTYPLRFIVGAGPFPSVVVVIRSLFSFVVSSSPAVVLGFGIINGVASSFGRLAVSTSFSILTTLASASANLTTSHK